MVDTAEGWFEQADLPRLVLGIFEISASKKSLTLEILKAIPVLT